MIRETGNMFNIVNTITNNHALIITTNSCIRKDGALVMGRGAAKTAANLWPTVPFEFGRRISNLGTYGVILLPQTDKRPEIGAFQVKHHFADNADLGLIVDSVSMLSRIAQRFPNKRYDLNYPGIGNGRLSFDSVDPLLQDLPDNVHIWTF